MIDQQIEQHLDQFLGKDYGTETFAEWAGKQFGVEFEARDFRGTGFPGRRGLTPATRPSARPRARCSTPSKRTCPTRPIRAEWNWEALAKMANTCWHLSLRDRDLKQVGREGVGELLIEKAREAICKVGPRARRGLPGGRLRPAVGLRLGALQVQHRPDAGGSGRPGARGHEGPGPRSGAEAAYHEKEIEYPVMAGLSHFTTRDPAGHKRYDREGLVGLGAASDSSVDLDLDDLKNKQRDEIRALLVEQSRQYSEIGRRLQAEAESRLAQAFNGETPSSKRCATPSTRAACSRSPRGRAKTLELNLPPEKMARLAPEALQSQLTTAVEELYRPEMRRMERELVLQLLDVAWKDHLLTMDHLRSSVGLRGYAQVDPKVEFKREGMRIFGQMWESIGERVTDLVFRMEQLDEGFVGSTWKETEAIHEDSSAAGGIAQQQREAIEGTQTDHKPQPIRNRQQRVGRNDPCPCGSGKKFKNCCMRK